MRKLMVALAATAAFGIAAIPTSASAQWHGHGGWRGGGGYYGGGPYYGGPYAYGPGFYSGGCYRTIYVSTPRGLRLRRVWVCG